MLCRKLGRRGEPSRRGPIAASVSAALAIVLASSTVAAAEPLVGTGQQSADGTYVAIATQGHASSSQGVAVSGTGTSYGEVEVEATNKVVTVDEPTSGDTIGLDNTGDVGSSPLSADQALDALYKPPPEVIAAKEAAVAKLQPEIEYQLAALRFGLDPTLADRVCPDGRCPTRTKTLNQPYTHQVTHYFCGPASTAAVLWQQTGSNWNQHDLAQRNWLNTTTDGTHYGSIVLVMNRVFADRGIHLRYYAHEVHPDRPSSYMTKLVAAVDYWDGYVNHSIVNNVKTSFLDYWGDKRYPALHFNVSHGYDLSGGGYVDITEIYDPTKVSSKRKTNPYGQRRIPLDQIYNAVMGNKRIVIY